MKREKKQMIPTEDGMKPITVLPDVVKSPKLTVDWEKCPYPCSKGRVFHAGIYGWNCGYGKEPCADLSQHSDEQKSMFEEIRAHRKPLENARNVAGCGKGKYGAYCKSKCGRNVGKAMGTDFPIRRLRVCWRGKRLSSKGLKGKKGTYDAYLIPEGIEDYSIPKMARKPKVPQDKASTGVCKRSKSTAQKMDDTEHEMK